MQIHSKKSLNMWQIKCNAYWTNVVLNSKEPMNKQNLETVYAHIDDCIEYPTIGLLARKKFGVSQNKDVYQKQKKILQKNSRVSFLEEAFSSLFTSFYPRTGNARKYLIESGSIGLDKTKPIKHDFKRNFFKLFGKAL